MLDEKKLSADQGAHLDLQNTYQTYLTKNFKDDLEELNAIKAEEQWSYQLPFELNLNYQNSFNLFKNKFTAIINEIHIKLA